MLDPGLNAVPEPESITVPVPLRQKVVVPVPASVPQHCNILLAQWLDFFITFLTF